MNGTDALKALERVVEARRVALRNNYNFADRPPALPDDCVGISLADLRAALASKDAGPQPDPHHEWARASKGSAGGLAAHPQERVSMTYAEYERLRAHRASDADVGHDQAMTNTPGVRQITDPFVVKHYGDTEHPIIKGNGFDGLVLGEYREEAEEFIAAVNALSQRLAQCEKDADRYRWLREQDNEDFRFSVIRNPHFDVFESPTDLDAAIDAALSAAQDKV